MYQFARLYPEVSAEEHEKNCEEVAHELADHIDNLFDELWEQGILGFSKRPPRERIIAYMQGTTPQEVMMLLDPNYLVMARAGQWPIPQSRPVPTGRMQPQDIGDGIVVQTPEMTESNVWRIWWELPWTWIEKLLADFRHCHKIEMDKAANNGDGAVTRTAAPPPAARGY